MSDEQKQGKFFQFPLYVFAQTGDFKEILWDAFGFGIVNFIKTLSDYTENFEERLSSNPAAYEEEAEMLMSQARHSMGFTSGALKYEFKRYHKVQAHTHYLEKRHGKTCSVRLRTDIAFDYILRDDFSEREIRILCGLYSMIGAKPYSKVGWPMIQARAAGKMKPSSFHQSNEQGPIYSRGQIERTCEALLDRGLIFCASYGTGKRKGERFWSHRLNQKDLCEAVVAAKVKSRARVEDRKALNDQMVEKVRNQIQTRGNPAY